MTEISEDAMKKIEDVATHTPGLLGIYITCEMKKSEDRKLIKFWRGFLCFIIPWFFFVWTITKAPEIKSWPTLVLYLFAGFGVSWIADTLKKICELIFD